MTTIKPLKIFIVKVINGHAVNVPFLTFEEAENFVFQSYDPDNATMSLSKFMEYNAPHPIYNIDPELPFYVFEPKGSYELYITNSHDEFLERVSHQLQETKDNHYGSLYVNFEKIEDFPHDNEVKKIAAKKYQEYLDVFHKYKSVIDKKICDRCCIAKNNANQLLDYCYNSMIIDLDVKFREQLNGKIVCWNKVVPYFGMEWKYIHFNDYIPVSIIDNKAGIKSKDRNYSYELSDEEIKKILKILNEALDYYNDGNDSIAIITLLKMYNLFETFKEDPDNSNGYSLFD